MYNRFMPEEKLSDNHDFTQNNETEFDPRPDPAFDTYDVVMSPPETHDSYFGGHVVVIEAQPADPSTRAIITPSTPDIYYAHGAGWAQEEPTIKEMARQGRRAFSMEFMGSRLADPNFVIGKSETGLVEVNKRDIKTMLGSLSMIVPRQQMREAASLLGLISERGEENPASGRIDAVFQSESAGHGLIAVYTDPEKFHNVVLAFPGSISGPQTGFIPGRVAKEALLQRQYRPTPDTDFRPSDRPRRIESLKAQLRSPGFREDALALRYSALSSMLHSIRQKENAPGITLVAGLDDQIFSFEAYLESLVSANDVNAIIVVPGGHAIGGRKDVLATILDQFPTMERARNEPLLALRDRIILPPGIPEARVQKIHALADAVDSRTVVHT